jgi:AraC-like DNA-binding protein
MCWNTSRSRTRRRRSRRTASGRLRSRRGQEPGGSLARPLAAEDATFTDVLEGLRGDLARQYLADEALTISQVAWLLGYQEISAFTHAFKRWTGMTPREARNVREAAAS